MKSEFISQPRSQKIHLKTSIPGPRSRLLREREDQYLAPGLQNFALMAGIVVDHARGSTVTDVDGNTMIDLIGGIGVNGLGHSHPKWIKAVQEQMLMTSVGSFTSMPRIKLLECLSENAPAPGVNRLQLYSGGSEAVESALRQAKSYTKKHEFVSFWGGFHGKTLGSLSLMGSDFKQDLGPMAPGNHTVPYANCYRCPLQKKPSDCGMACVELAKKQIKMNSSGNIAAVVVEPMQGTSGNVVPPDDFLLAVQDMSHSLGALLIVDEMITGFGRTGKYWGSQHSGIKPDIVTLGKQFGGGFPVSAVLSREDIVQSKPWGNPSGSSSSYGGNPLAAVAAHASLKIIEDESLVENSRQVGAYFLKKLEGLQEKYSFIDNAHGRGLFLGLDMVKDKKSKEPLSKAACHKIFDACLKRGLLTMAYVSTFRIQPAMTIDTSTVNHALEVLDEVFGVAENENWKDN